MSKANKKPKDTVAPQKRQIPDPLTLNSWCRTRTQEKTDFLSQTGVSGHISTVGAFLH